MRNRLGKTEPKSDRIDSEKRKRVGGGTYFREDGGFSTTRKRSTEGMKIVQVGMRERERSTQIGGRGGNQKGEYRSGEIYGRGKKTIRVWTGGFKGGKGRKRQRT